VGVLIDGNCGENRVSKYRVCVVDDSEDAAAVLCEGLREHGYDAVAAYTGEEALERCAQGDIDLILLDVCMPGLDGYEVCARLKADPSLQDIVVVFVTVKGAKEDIDRGYALGAVDYITKPFNLPTVLLRVDAAMRRGRGDQPQRPQHDPLGDPTHTDELTGLRNGPYLIDHLQQEIDKARRCGYPLACVVFDVDKTEALDADLGTAPLDDLLIELAMALRAHTRNYDILARYDGTVFAVVLPHTTLEAAVNYAQKIRDDVDATTFSDPSFPTTVSLTAGVVACQNGTPVCAEELLGVAMRGLLQAKSIPQGLVVTRDLDL